MLVTALVFLIILSVLAVMAMRGAVFDERMSANDRDMSMAREYAELALRDAERDILGLRFDGSFCGGGSGCRPAGTRPADAADAGNFWVAANTAIDDVARDDGGVSESDIALQGIFTARSALACGMPVWSGANWADGANPARTCTGAIGVPLPTIPYGTFTGAPFNPPNVARPRYIIEMFKAEELGFFDSNKIFFRITAVGFGQSTRGNNRATSVTLQSVYSPL